MRKKESRKKEFGDNRTSWKWFQRNFDTHHDISDRLHDIRAFQARIFIEILKELQYLNDRKS